jgi:hypothetical protein
MNQKIADYLIWIIDLTANRLFNGNITKTYKVLKKENLLNFYAAHYDTSHTLGQEYILEEIQERLNKK